MYVYISINVRNMIPVTLNTAVKKNWRPQWTPKDQKWHCNDALDLYMTRALDT
jgi:hypothetical protein